MAGKLQFYTDVHGQQHEIQYDAFDRPQTLVQGNLTVTLSYDQANRLSESCVQDETSNLTVTTQLDYDDFGREVARIVQKGEETLYTLSQTYNTLGLMNTRDMEDGASNMLRSETYQYDSLSRLVDYQCQGSQSPVDGYGNQLQHEMLKIK